MEVLIRQILREFVDNKVEIKVIGNVSDLLNEQINPVDFNITKEIISRRLRRINPFVGNFKDKRTGDDKIVGFVINPKPHYLNRTFRLSDPEYKETGKHYDPKLSNPGPLEGIDLIYNNRDKIAEQILIGRIKDNDIVEVSSADGSNYHMIVKFDKQYGKNPRYELTLVTQIKGAQFYGKKSQSKLKLYPNPKN
jgi:hypothetical protein